MKKKSSLQDFRHAVLAVVKKIPRGSFLTYGEVAALAGFPGAARAVGTVMRLNYDDSIPCHRVIRADGKVGHYNRGGSKVKERRLQEEGYVHPRS